MIISIDIGNGYVKAVNERSKTLHFPTALKEKSDDDIVFNKNANYIIKIDDSEFFVGDIAIVKGADRSWKAGREYNKNTYYYIALCSHLLSGDSNEVSICLGLPFSYFIGLNKGKALVEELENKEIRTEYGGKNKSIKIKKVSVYCQGIGAYMCNLFDSKGKLLANVPSLIKSLVIDIGFRTVDVVGFEKINGQFELKTGFSLEHMGITNSLSQIVKNISKFTDFNINEIEYAIKDNDSKLSYTFGEIDLREYEEKAYLQLAEMIMSEVSRRLAGDLNKYNNIFITGGGAAKIEKYIKNSFDQVKLQNDPIFANAKGYIILEQMS